MDSRDVINILCWHARFIGSLHVSNGDLKNPVCIFCDQEYPCVTIQQTETIELIGKSIGSGPGAERMSAPQKIWVAGSMKTIGLCCGRIFGDQSEEYSKIFEQLSLLHNLPGIVESGYDDFYSGGQIQINLIAPTAVEPIPLWSLYASLIDQELSLSLWLNPSHGSSTRPFLAELMVGIMTPLASADLLDSWRSQDLTPACIVEYRLPPNGAVVLEIVKALVTATIECSNHFLLEIEGD